MANMIERILQRTFYNAFWSSGIIDELKAASKRRNYRAGDQRQTLKVRPGQHDDNVTLNFTGLIIDRSVTLLFGKGIEFDLPGEGDTNPTQDYINAVMDANKKAILLHKLAIWGAEQGTCFLKIMEDGMIGADGNEYPRLIIWDPALTTITTLPDDQEVVIKYEYQYTATDLQGKERGYKQEVMAGNWIEQPTGEDEPTLIMQTADPSEAPNNWLIRDSITNDNGIFQVANEVIWPYDFAPILHWQNLPEPGSPYGVPDITEDIIRLQDQINFLSSNVNKIVRYYAHPQRWGRKLGQAGFIGTGPDKIYNFNDETGMLDQLDPTADLNGSLMHIQSNIKALFDITQTVDLSSHEERIGALTNFGLRVLYTDALAKLNTKRELYGDALLELVRRLLVIGNMQADPGIIVWPEILPESEQEQVTQHQFELDYKLKSKQTVAKERGIEDWEAEQERIDGEASDLGTTILRAFETQRGA